MKVFIVFGSFEKKLVLLGIYPTLELAEKRIYSELDNFDVVFYEDMETGANGVDCHFDLDW